MTNLIHKSGDIFTTTAPAIGHGVNVHGVMGSGIAVQFRDRFPAMYEDYKVLCKKGSLKPGEMMPWEAKPGMYVYNIASQDAPGPNARYEWLESGVKAALIHAAAHNISVIALPRIASGVGGLNERDCELILYNLAISSYVDIEIWTLPRG